MSRSNYALRLSTSLKAEAERVAKADGTTLNQFINVAVAEINRRGGIRGRRVRVQVFDDGSNPSQAVSHMNRVADDDKFLGVIGSGFSSSGLAVAPIVEREQIPYISMASSVAQVSPAKPFYYMTTATSRLFAYSMAFQLRKQGIRRIAVRAVSPDDLQIGIVERRRLRVGDVRLARLVHENPA